MKKTKADINQSLSILSALKPVSSSEPTLGQQSPAPAAAHKSAPAEKIFPEPMPTSSRISMVLFEEDLKMIDALHEAAKAHGLRNINQSQAIRTLLRAGKFNVTILNAVLSEDRRRKGK